MQSFCDKCAVIFNNLASESSYEGPLHPDTASLTKAADDGCRICMDVLWHLKQESFATSSPLTYSCSPLAKREADDACRLLEIGCSTAEGVDKVICLYSVGPGNAVPLNSSIARRKGVIPFLGSSDNARKWIKACTHDHVQCKTTHLQPSFYPTRLLELQKGSIRLVSTKQRTIKGPYAALNYCWGPPPYHFLRLSASNMIQLQAGIPVDQLPLAFREAIEFSRILGIDYLWIDCLCIIQDGRGSREDWLREATLMQQVYENCFVCLALYRAANPHDSIFIGPDSGFTAPYKVITRTTSIHDAVPDNEITVFPYAYFWDALERQPLGSRAWALQEKLLPSRTIAFGAGEVFWTCRQLPHACETLPDGLGQFIMTANLPVSSIPETTNIHKLLAAWFDFVKNYTGRFLTYPESDILVAISAIGIRISQAMDDDYLEGHFWKTLALSLYWSASYIAIDNGPWYLTARRTYHRGTHGHITKQVPSTWSWASTDMRLYFDKAAYGFEHTGLKENGFSPTAETLATFARYPGCPGVAGVQSTVLKMSTSCIEGILTCDKCYDKPDIDGTASQSFAFKDATDSGVAKVVVWADDLDTIPQEGWDVLFSPLFLTNYHVYKVLNGECVRGLFIKKMGTIGDGALFERVGCGMIMLEHGVTWSDMVERLGLTDRTVLLA